MWQGKSFKDLLSNKKVLRIAVIIGLCAIILLALSSVIRPEPDNTALTQAYAEKTEQRLLDIVSRISGVGEAEIFLTMDNAGESVYVKNSDNKTLSIEPRVRGVVVVCEGGDDPVVASHVLEAVTKALAISTDKVCITK